MSDVIRYFTGGVRRSVGRGVGRFIVSGLGSDFGGKVESGDDAEFGL